jgi:hypothetical protein
LIFLSDNTIRTALAFSRQQRESGCVIRARSQKEIWGNGHGVGRVGRILPAAELIA